jgi:hypothetical protein
MNAEPRTNPSTSNKDAAAAVAELVDRIEAFRKNGQPALQVSFKVADRSIAKVELQRTAKGEVAVHLSAVDGASRAEVASHVKLLGQRLQESGLRVAALIIR